MDGDNDSVENNTAGSGLQSEDNAKGSAVSTGPDPEMKPSPKQVGLHREFLSHAKIRSPRCRFRLTCIFLQFHDDAGIL